MINIEELFDVAKKTAVNAGLIIKQLEQDREVLSSKGKDIKTLADKQSEALILSELSKYDIPFLSEESGLTGNTNVHGYRWIIDPLDGTFNFVHQFNQYCTSIALWKDNDPIFGVIYNIPEAVLFSGFVGRGAWKDEAPIHMSDVKAKTDAVLATGFPVSFNFDEEETKFYLSDMIEYKKIRMIGSAALSLAYVSEGVFDAYRENNIYLWDVAAGVALIKAVGGQVTIVFNDKFRLNISACWSK